MTPDRDSCGLRWSIAFTLAALAGLLACMYTGSAAGAWFKMAASTGFLAAALAAGALHSTYGRVVFAALVLCWWGDLFLTGNQELHFLLGLAAFLLGHIAFAAAFLVCGVNRVWALAAAAGGCIPAAIVLRWLGPQLGGLAWPVYAYIAVITVMAALAIGTLGRGATRLIAIGAALFYLSDLFVARQKFAEPSVWNPLIGLPLYYAAQLCLAAGITQVRPARA